MSVRKLTGCSYRDLETSHETAERCMVKPSNGRWKLTSLERREARRAARSAPSLRAHPALRTHQMQNERAAKQLPPGREEPPQLQPAPPLAPSSALSSARRPGARLPGSWRKRQNPPDTSQSLSTRTGLLSPPRSAPVRGETRSRLSGTATELNRP